MNLRQLNQKLQLSQEFKTALDTEITGAQIDSRAVQQGDVFFAFQGDKVDGFDYIQDAINNGARAIIAQNHKKQTITAKLSIPIAYCEDSQSTLVLMAKAFRKVYHSHVQFIAITGSNGKTTIKNIIASVLKQKFRVYATLGNLNNEIGVPLTLINMTKDTEIAVFELGARHVGDIHYLCSIVKPKLVLLSNISNAHRGEFGGLEKQLQTKEEIFNSATQAVLDLDSPYLESHKKTCLNKEVIYIRSLSKQKEETTSCKKTEDFTTWQWQKGVSYFKNIEGSFDLSLPLLGSHNTHNAAWAVAIGNHFGLSNEQIKQGLKTSPSADGRLQEIPRKNWTIIDDSYNASPESVLALLQTVSTDERFATFQKIMVFGDMLEIGDKTEKHHRQVAHWSKKHGINTLFAIGSLAKKTVEESTEYNLVNKSQHFETLTQLVIKLKSHLKQPHDKPFLILLKASNAFQLYKITEYL